MLDPLQLKETRKKIVYTEHYYPRQEQTVARFNSWYLGGIAHELGHGLGLDHDAGEAAEQGFGTSLMGLGNHTYRQEVWGGGRPTFLSRASALLLASHPLFTGSNRGRRDEVGIGFAVLTFVADGKALEIRGVVERDIEPHAVVAQVWPARVKEQNNHAARTFPTVVRDGAFTLRVAGLAPDAYTVNLTSLHVNGGVTTQRLRCVFDAAGRPDVAALNAAWRASFLERVEVAVMTRQSVARKFLSEDAASGSRSADERRKLQVLRAVLDPVPPVDLASVTGDRVFLSDVNWTEARVGWGQAARNHTWFDGENQNGVFLTVGGRFYDKGLYAHSASRYAYDLGGRWKTLTATVGLRDGAHQQGSAVFTVRGDGRELHRSRMLRVGASAAMKVNVAGVRQLELIAESGEGHVHNSWAIWAEPELRR